MVFKKNSDGSKKGIKKLLYIPDCSDVRIHTGWEGLSRGILGVHSGLEQTHQQKR